MCEVKMGADEQKAELVSGREFDTKDASKSESWEAQRKKETKEQNGCLDTEEEEEGEEEGERAKSEGKLPHSYTQKHNKWTPAPFKRPSVAWNGWVCVCVFENISVLILVPPERAEHRGEEGREAGVKGSASASYQSL